MSDETTPATPADAVEAVVPAPKPAITWQGLVIAAIFGFAFAYFVYEAIGNLINLPKTYAAVSLSADTPWALLIVGLLIPIAVYVLAFVIGLRRGLIDKAVIYVLGLAVTAGLGYTVVALHRITFDLLVLPAPGA